MVIQHRQCYLSKVVKQAEDVFTSTDASTPTTFTFKAPVFIPYRTEHCMVLTSDSNQYKSIHIFTR